MWNDKLFNKTLFFAIKAHGDQKMKHPENMPYFAHIVGVMATALNHTFGENVDVDFIIQLALLHDVLEDTSVQYDDLVLNFGERVASGVNALSKNKDLIPAQQMNNCLEKIVLEPKEVAIVKLADRCFNLRERVPMWTKEKQESYKKEGQNICNKLGFSSERLKQELQKRIDNY